ncbi:hypothetical protein NEOKW01_0326 [Nematocida sp. AWRm80]|nr:hypothetical protein NEOKW01_0326 [Nematocida sp. AWRm80]
MEEKNRIHRSRSLELTPFQKDQLDSYFYKHDIKLTKKNLKGVSKILNISHRKIVEYVNRRQQCTRESVHNEYLKTIDTLYDISTQIQEIWKRFDSIYK